MPVVSTFLRDSQVALAGLLVSFKAANPTLVKQTYRALPRTFYVPCAYVGDIGYPSILHGQGIRTVLPSAELVVVEGVYDNAESQDRLLILLDALTTYLSNNPHAVSGATLWQPVSALSRSLTLGQGGQQVTYAGGVVTLNGDAQEGGLDS